MRFIILPTREIAEDLRSTIEGWCERNGLGEFVGKVTNENCVEIVHSIVYDYIDDRMEWIKTKPQYLEDQLVKSLATFENVKIVHRIYYDLIDDVERRIRRIMKPFLSMPTWYIFHIKRISGDMIIERGEDYRIVDWKRRYDRGEIKLDDAV